jgi:hypothetical protein
MHGFLIVMLVMNIIISVPMFQTEIRFSHNFDNAGIIGKEIHYNINPDAIIFFDDSSFEPPWDGYIYALIDYWIVNDLHSVNLTNIALSGDYSVIQGGDYIVIMLEGSGEALHTSPSGLSLYRLR